MHPPLSMFVAIFGQIDLQRFPLPGESLVASGVSRVDRSLVALVAAMETPHAWLAPADSDEELVDPSFVAAAHASAPVAPPVDPALVAVAPPVDGTLVAAAPVAAAPVAPPVEEAPVDQAPMHVKAAPVAAPVDRASKKRNKVGGAAVEEKAAVAGIGTPYLSLCI